jgi:hypothetical protein
MNLIAAAEGRSVLAELDGDLRRMLTFIAGELDADKQVCITDVLQRGEFGVPMTASKRLRELEAQGWVIIVQDPSNHRRRLLGLTTKSRAAFRQVSRHVTRRLPEIAAPAGTTE